MRQCLIFDEESRKENLWNLGQYAQVKNAAIIFWCKQQAYRERIDLCTGYHIGPHTVNENHIHRLPTDVLIYNPCVLHRDGYDVYACPSSGNICQCLVHWKLLIVGTHVRWVLIKISSMRAYIILIAVCIATFRAMHYDEGAFAMTYMKHIHVHYCKPTSAAKCHKGNTEKKTLLNLWGQK